MHCFKNVIYLIWLPISLHHKCSMLFEQLMKARVRKKRTNNREIVEDQVQTTRKTRILNSYVNYSTKKILIHRFICSNHLLLSQLNLKLHYHDVVHYLQLKKNSCHRMIHSNLLHIIHVQHGLINQLQQNY
jgi:hypothetical protein